MSKTKSNETRVTSGIQSVVVGMPLLRALAWSTGDLTLTELAGAAEMPPSKAYRYLIGYIETGLVRYSPETGRYDLGPLALDMGLAALRRLDVVRLAEPIIRTLGKEVGEAISLTVWGNRGTTIVRWQESGRPVTITQTVGTVLPLLTSSNGQIFLTYLPPEITEATIRQELQSANAKAAGLKNLTDTRQLADRIRARGMAVVEGQVLPGICSLSVPVFRHDQSLACGLSVVGFQGFMDLAEDGHPATRLRAAAGELSTLLGAHSLAGTQGPSGPRTRRRA